MEDYNKNAKRFFIYSYLNIDINDVEDKDDGIMKCARRAYRDLNRTLRFNEKSKNTCDRQKFVTDICRFVKKEIKNLFELNKNKELDFDDKHKDICNKIIKEAENWKNQNEESIWEKDTADDKNIYYGQAQKWLNMTLKYMWLTGIWESEFNTGDLLSELHVPVDSYIIEAVWKNTNIPSPIRKGANRDKDYKHPADKVKAWSKWEGAQEDSDHEKSQENSEYENVSYEAFQKGLKQELKKEGMIPILWENSKWIEIAKKRN